MTEPYQSKAGTKYSNADRTYSLELYRVAGGGTIDQAHRSMLRTMPKDNSYTVDAVGLHNRRSITHVTGDNRNKWKRLRIQRIRAEKATNVSFLKNRDNAINYNTRSSLLTIIGCTATGVSKIHSRRMVLPVCAEGI